MEGRALVVDDLAASREWLSRALALAFPALAIDVAVDLAGAFAHAQPPPALALVDLGLPDGSGVTLIEYLAPRGTLCVVAPERGAERARDAGHGAQRDLQAHALGGGDDHPVELLVERDLVVDGLLTARIDGLRR